MLALTLFTRTVTWEVRKMTVKFSCSVTVHLVFHIPYFTNLLQHHCDTVRERCKEADGKAEGRMWLIYICRAENQ